MIPVELAAEIEGPDARHPIFTGKIYGTKDEALTALSDAAVRIGRAAVGLPPLVGQPVTVVG